MLESATLVGGERVRAHPAAQCAGQVCCVHAPSTHIMSNFPQHWRDDAGKMERVCPHGIGHPDPDELDFVKRTRGFEEMIILSMHGCDGCCTEVTMEVIDRLRDTATTLWFERTKVRLEYGTSSRNYEATVRMYNAAAKLVESALARYHKQKKQIPPADTRLVKAQWMPITSEA